MACRNRDLRMTRERWRRGPCGAEIFSWSSLQWGFRQCNRVFRKERSMKRIILLCLALMLAACAHMTRPTTDQQFESYRAEVRAERDAGKITGVEEQEKLRDRFWKLYGKDANS